MARDIEDFLRRAAERRQQQMKQKQGGAPPPPRPAAPKPQRRPLVISDDEVEVVDMRKQSVKEHVQSHIDTSDIAYHAEHLSDRIAQTDEKVEARIQQKFDHDLGKLEKSGGAQSDIPTEATKDVVSGAAKDIVDLIRSPKTMRQAILMVEILNRPDFKE